MAISSTGLAVAAYGGVSGIVATADIGKSLKLLYELSGDVTAGSDAADNQESLEQPKKFENKEDLTQIEKANYKQIDSNKEANKEAKKLGYDGAEDLKDFYYPGQGAHFNIWKDNTTRKLQLCRIGNGSIRTNVEPIN